MKVRSANGGEYYEVTEEAIERLRVPQDLRIPGVPQSTENIARECLFFRLFGTTATVAVLVRFVSESSVAIVVTGEGKAGFPPYSSYGLLTREDDGSIEFGEIAGAIPHSAWQDRKTPIG